MQTRPVNNYRVLQVYFNLLEYEKQPATNRNEVKMKETKLDLTPFCAGEDTRYALTKTFVTDGHLTATDGRIIVRIPTEEPEINDRPVPDIAALFNKQFEEFPAFDMYSINMVRIKCSLCAGKGKVKLDCETCGGDGRCMCPCCGSDTYCEDCDGDGKASDEVDCYQCSGAGRVFDNVKIGGKMFNGHYINKILCYLPHPKAVAISQDIGCLRFTFDGGEGLLVEFIERPGHE